MQKVDFDEYAETYRQSLNACFAPFGARDTFFDEYKVKCIKEWVIFNDRAYDILDYGCGVGKIAGLLAKEFSKSTVYGWDISKESLRVARDEYRELANIHFVDELPQEQKYNFLVVTMVFHHIHPAERIEALEKMKNLLKPGGKIIVFEHNPLNPFTQYIVKTCASDTDARLILRPRFIKLAKSCGFDIAFKRHILFFPWPSKLLWHLERLLRFIPLGAQYVVVLTQK
ncbi:MAG TPA: class I SAM-dependent methyltransferase [Candidatus Paceibacterota bacterium]